MLKRVVITGMGVVSPLGNSVEAVVKGIEENKSAVRCMKGWEEYTGLRCLLGCPAAATDE